MRRCINRCKILLTPAHVHALVIALPLTLRLQVIAINKDDPKAALMNDIADVEKVRPHAMGPRRIRNQQQTARRPLTIETSSRV